jgi:very-short-patch-repair endonuclease/DNA polymerase III delta prime subunit
LSEIRQQILTLISEEDFDEERFHRLVRTVSGASQSLRNLKYVPGRLHSLAELNAVDERSLPVLFQGAVLLNIPRGNAYLLDDLEKLAAEGKDEELSRTAVGPVLEVPSDSDDGSDQSSKRAPQPVEELLFPLESNQEQRRVASFASNSRVLVVHGPPGTGKSQTICNLVSHLVARGKTVLVTSQKDKALEVVRDKLPNIDYLAMTLLRTDKESQKALLQALEYYQSAIGQTNLSQLERAGQYLRERLSKNRKDANALEARFSELRRLEHQHFSTFKRMGDLRAHNKLDPDDEPSAEDPTRIGHFLQEYASYSEKLASQATAIDRWLLGAPSDRPLAVIDERLSFAQSLLGPLEKLGKLLKDSSVLALAREVDSTGVKGAEDVLQRWTEWLKSYAATWIEGRTKAISRNLPGCAREDVQKLAEKYRNATLKAWRTELDDIVRVIHNLEETPIPDRFTGRVLDREHVAQLGDVITVLDGAKGSLLKWVLFPSVRGSKAWLRSMNYPGLRWSQRLRRIAELEELAKHWQSRHKIRACLGKLHEAGVLEQTARSDSPVPSLLRLAEEAAQKLELAQIAPPSSPNGCESLYSIPYSRLEALEKAGAIDEELTKIDHARQILGSRDQLSRLLEELPTEFNEIAISAHSWEKEEIDGALEIVRRISSSLATGRRLTELERDQLASYRRSLASLRDEFKSRKEYPAWLPNAAEAVEAHRLFALARSVNAKNLDDTNTICEAIRRLTQEKRDAVIDLLRVQRRIQLLEASQRSGTAFAIQLAKKLLSKKRKTPSLEQIKEKISFKQLLAIFPCWVLSIDDVARIFPVEPGLFDYLIVDEASQCNQATALHLAYRAKQMVVVGDEKQLPNASVQWLREGTIKQLLARHNLANHPKSEFLSVHESLLGLALGSRDCEVHLNEHFRCDPKIIEWSNREFYRGTLRVLTPLRSLRFDRPIEIRYVPGACEDTEKRINVQEAEAIVNETARILDDPKLAGLSIGVISPFQPQADYIHARLQERFASHWSECEKRGLTASTADGFQGDERDIILYSLRHGPGSRPGAITGIEANQGPRRLNVAFTRARRKMILFTSLPNDTFPGRFIRSFLNHAQNAQSMPPGPFFVPAGQDKFHSQFEEQVCCSLRSRGFMVITQFPVSGYYIDLVVCDKEGRRLGVECDGSFHYDEFGQLREEDYEREEILERAGWRIQRIPARRFYLDPDREIARVIDLLAEQDTDAAVRIKEEEDLSTEKVTTYEEAAVSPVVRGMQEELPTVAVEPTSTQVTVWKPEEPPLDDGKVWIDLARWAKETGRWTMANRVFVWGVGDKIRAGRSMDEADRARAGVLWRDAFGQGFRPQ